MSPSKPTSTAVPPFNIVNRHNLSTLSLSISHALSRARWITLDTEFTGLGDPRKTKANDISERYQTLVELVRTHAIVAFGLTVFEEDTSQKSGHQSQQHVPMHMIVHNFQFTMLCRGNYVVSSSSTSFLAEHGFDFNDQILNGIPYSPGNDIRDEPPTSPNFMMRSIFNQILNLNVPVVFHNGLLDIMFIYQSFYADLPADLSTFVADLHGMFGGGLYDTKYISDFVTREERSFLSYLFRKYQRYHDRRCDNAQHPFITITTRNRIPHTYNRTTLTLVDLGLQSYRTNNIFQSPEMMELQATKAYCIEYANHGVCMQGTKCPHSHDLDLILDDEEANGISTSESTYGKPKQRRGTKRKSASSNVDGNTINHQPAATTESATSTSLTASDLTSKVIDTMQSTSVSSASVSMTESVDQDGTNGTKRSNVFETYHSACFDAFMTGYIFMHQLYLHDDLAKSVFTSVSTNGVSDITHEHRNKIYLIGKLIPLRIEKSIYAKPSTEHTRKHKKMQKKVSV